MLSFLIKCKLRLKFQKNYLTKTTFFFIFSAAKFESKINDY